ncbi:molybdopterin synthase catalytic subunit MoaE [Thiomicrorhabdus lithotrophica]|uniref:Molybdopterin synthase catalytic subunit n=1 Tax=Thiomicrorhabdus lithotrophica TaxID=2949997 RepID=A0ABY8CFD3_9GAMM|nr:molybdopterin synthase catalytic subunit MoaE [Thiomicrorhabdus lithotrophica]WEJ62823.1 molybdopterin synthase catalytic subunit MoaE [Thiomicrorhabdus lithotrophica]
MSEYPHIKIQQEDFDLTTEVAALRAGHKDIGAVVSFVGTVRDINEGDEVSILELEHYPGMTEKALEKIRLEAHERWALESSLIIHRIGKMYPTDQIVLVAVSSRHRENAFYASHFIMDYLKTNAPFWKKETLPNGDERWVDARITDKEAENRWIK